MFQYKYCTDQDIARTKAEEFERGTTNELLAFLYIARGSARCKLCFMQGGSRLQDFKSETDSRDCEEALRNIGG